MENSNDNGNTIKETPDTLTAAENTDESPNPEHTSGLEGAEDTAAAENSGFSEEPAREDSQPERSMKPEDLEESEEYLADSTGAPSDEPDQEDSLSGQSVQPEELEGSEEPLADQPGDLSVERDDEQTGEISSDEVRTALVTVRGQNRSAHFNAGEHTLKPGDEVVIKTEHGKAIGEILEPPVVLGCRGCKHLTILRKATPEEISKDNENRDLEKKAFEYCTKTIEEWEIPMRLVQVEFHFDRSKAVFYFTAEKRVDFRELVRTLAREFSTRIEMRQIGIRDEARLLGGVGPCGMAFCCSTFLKEFAPISVKMAKEQNVILNPNKISGGCGRLLCCLNYEYDQYREASRGVPKVGKKVNLQEGSGKVRSVDIFARTVTIDMTDDKPLVIDIDELRERMK